MFGFVASTSAGMNLVSCTQHEGDDGLQLDPQQIRDLATSLSIPNNHRLRRRGELE